MNNLRYDYQSIHAIGVDIGGTKINAGIVTQAGEILHHVNISTKAGLVSTQERVIEAVDQLLTESTILHPELRFKGIGIGSAGQIEWASGTIRFASEIIPGYSGTALGSIIQNSFRLPTVVDNDVNVLAWTERKLGYAQGVDNFICLALGTGVGGAIVVDGRIVHGSWGGAGELGHLSVDFNGIPCICGGRGCLEQYASGTSIARRMRERLLSADLPADNVDTREVFSRWKSGDSIATAVLNETIAALGSAIASLIHTFNPSLIVIGGGVAEAGERLFTELQQEVSRRAMPSFLEGVEIKAAYQGNWSGMVGAALQVWE